MAGHMLGKRLLLFLLPLGLVVCVVDHGQTRGRNDLRISISTQSKSSTLRPASSGWRATCSASAFSCFFFLSASSSVSSIMADSRTRDGGATLASIFASMRSIREALGFMGAGPLARSVCPVASNPVGNLVHADFELL